MFKYCSTVQMFQCFDDKNAQSIIEVIVAVAIFSLLGVVMASFVVGGFHGMVQGGEQTEAESLAQEGIEAVRSIRDRAWNEFIYDRSGVVISGNQWNFSGEGTTDTIGQFRRTIDFSDVCRDVSDEIATCPALYADVQSKDVTVDVTWEVREGISNTVSQASYLTNWDSQEWTQTDWSGGPGQSMWSDQSRYDSDDGNIDYDSVIGQVTLVDTSIGKWIFAGGVQVIDTNDTDFNSGDTSDNTAVSGAGVGASVVLSQATIWAEHVDSGELTLKRINDIDVVSALNMWAVGDSAEIFHYNGSSWSKVDDKGSKNLYAVDMLSSSDGWAVGQGGKIYRYDGNNWNEVSSPTTKRLYDLDMVSSSDGWIVGESGKVLYYNGTSWVEFIDLGGDNIYAIDMVSANDGWLGGENGDILAHYNGTQWSTVSFSGNKDINSIFMISSSDGWIVGDDGELFYYNGVNWSSATSPTSNDIYDIFMISSSDGWIVGKNGEIYHYDGSSWSSVTPPTSSELHGIYMLSTSDGWAVGKDGTILEYGDFYSNSGTFLSRVFDSGDITTSWDQAYWTEVLSSGSDLTIATRTGNTATPDVTWSSFSAELTEFESSNISSPEDRYFQYRATLTRGDSATATPQLDDITIIYNVPTTKNLNDLDIVSSSDIWVVGNSGKILHYNGTSWSEFVDLGDDEIYAIDMISSTDGWAVGDDGEIIYFNGTSWSSVPSPIGPEDDLNSVYMLSSSDGWAVGDDGKVFHYDGSTWSEFVDTGDQVWNSIFLVSASLGWMVGDSGRIWRYNGTTWSEFVDTGSPNWRSVYLIASNDGWVGGHNGDLQHFDGTNWTSISSPTTRRIKSLQMIDTADGWAVGDNGTILQLTTEGLYVENGYLISSAYLLGNVSPVQVIEWDQTIPTCSPTCEIRLQVRTAPDSSGSPGTWTAWYGVSGSGSYFTNENGTLIPTALNGNSWVQYRAELSGDGLNTPVLEEVRVNYK
ncbi:hypothetical protein MYX07_03635 [Patescibacteria group bacterium AH-259-L07]|nr:hypothetical protein [Patescibacteria group bacterium AH-259-L07]